MSTLYITVAAIIAGFVIGCFLLLYTLMCSYAEDYIHQRFDRVKLIHYFAMLCPIWNAYLAYLYFKSKDASIKKWVKRIYEEQFKWR